MGFAKKIQASTEKNGFLLKKIRVFNQNVWCYLTYLTEMPATTPGYDVELALDAYLQDI